MSTFIPFIFLSWQYHYIVLFSEFNLKEDLCQVIIKLSS